MQIYHPGGSYRVVFSPEEHAQARTEGWVDEPEEGLEYIVWTADQSDVDRVTERNRIARAAALGILPTIKNRAGRYDDIDSVLREIEKSNPLSLRDITNSLAGRTRHPDAEPFRSAGGWVQGLKKDPGLARSWVSKRRAGLELKPLPRGPK